MTVETKTCTGCGETKPVSEYFLDKRRGRPRARCKVCCSKAIKAHYASNKGYYADHAKRWREANREKSNEVSNRSRAARRRRVHEAWHSYQGGCCAVCRRAIADPLDMHLDHCHRTGRVRGLLCKPCNYILGFCDDAEAILLSAVEYLRVHEADPSQLKLHKKSAWWRSFPPGYSAAGPT